MTVTVTFSPDFRATVSGVISKPCDLAKVMVMGPGAVFDRIICPDSPAFSVSEFLSTRILLSAISGVVSEVPGGRGDGGSFPSAGDGALTRPNGVLRSAS